MAASTDDIVLVSSFNSGRRDPVGAIVTEGTAAGNSICDDGRRSAAVRALDSGFRGEIASVPAR
jgi:hypothetical protein